MIKHALLKMYNMLTTEQCLEVGRCILTRKKNDGVYDRLLDGNAYYIMLFYTNQSTCNVSPNDL